MQSTLPGRFLCTTEEYDNLYSRYLQNNGKLLELAGFTPQHKLLDLCGGTGAASLAAIAQGADPSRITLVDLNPRCHDERIRQLRGHALGKMHELAAEQQQFDVAVCRQAFAYLEVEGERGQELAATMAALLPPGGKFVFNSFIRPRFHVKTYRFQGQRYIEAAGYFRRRVFHLQVNLRRGYDLTISKWHREERIYQIFQQYFHVETRWSDNAMYWLCTRRDEVNHA